MCLSFLSCHRSLTAVQSNKSPTSGTVQKLGAEIPDTDLCSSTKSPPFFALIIGINEYTSPKVCNLEGAVPDALAVKTYLENDLGVPASQIRLLLNAEATRSAIIQEFYNLIADQRIHRGDPILIYYAGYGGEVDAPKGWESHDAKIQMVIPHDFRTIVDGRTTCGIPDRTIGTLLSRVAGKWDDNIVCLPELHYNVYAADEIICIDCHLRLLLLWIWHPGPFCIKIQSYCTGH
jgi:Caspase domain